MLMMIRDSKIEIDYFIHDSSKLNHSLAHGEKDFPLILELLDLVHSLLEVLKLELLRDRSSEVLATRIDVLPDDINEELEAVLFEFISDVPI